MYREVNVSAEDEQRFRELIKPEHWDSKRFKDVILMSANLDVYPYHTPKTIDLKGFKRVIDELKAISDKTQAEAGRFLLVNIKNNQLMAGNICQGSKNICVVQTNIPRAETKTIKEKILIHTHPNLFNDMAFSPIDYATFLSNPNLISSIVSCGDTMFILMKNLGTPNTCNTQSAIKQISDIINDFPNKKSTLPNIIKCQKEICLANGLSLFMVSAQDKTLAKKIPLITQKEE